jgi:hypothetical protein
MTALFEPTEDQKKVWIDAQKAMSLPVGAASPLWLMFAGAASAGVAYWWLSRWRNATHLEAVLAPTLAELESEPLPVVPEVIAPAVVEAFEAAADSETVSEPTVEAIPEAVAEAEAEPALDAAPEPVLEVAPTPKPSTKPRTKAAAVRAAPRTVSGPTRRS